jgi:hypothetical protein
MSIKRSLVLFVVTLVCILSICIFIALPVFELLSKTDLFPNNDHSIISIYSASLIVLTFFLVIATGALAYVAYIQIDSARKQLEQIGNSTRADFLIRLDNRYGSKQIIKARQIIHALYLESKKIQRISEENEDIHRNYIAEKINDYAEDPEKANDYVYLLNLMDFLETISFLANKGIIQKEEITDLMGLSLNFFWDIFHIRIKVRRQKYGDMRYKEFENLIHSQKN